MKFLDWYVKIGLVSALVGASMEFFMIKTGFCLVAATPALGQATYPKFLGSLFDVTDDKVTVLESEKRAWESSPEALAMKEALNPWRQKDSNVKENI